MKDDNKERDLDKNPIISKLSTLNKKIILGVVLFLILIFLGYSALKGKFPSSGDMFTTYGPLPYDSVNVTGGWESSSTLKNASDSLSTSELVDSITNRGKNTNGVSKVDSLLSNTKLDSTAINDKKEIENLFHVNTHYDKIDVKSSKTTN